MPVWQRPAAHQLDRGTQRRHALDREGGTLSRSAALSVSGCSARRARHGRTSDRPECVNRYTLRAMPLPGRRLSPERFRRLVFQSAESEGLEKYIHLDIEI